MPVINQEEFLYYSLPMLGALGGTYLLYKQHQSPFAPGIIDLIQLSYAVANGLMSTQPLPAQWQSSNRLMLEMFGTRPEVLSVNRAMDYYGIVLDNRELALFLIQSEYKMDYFNSRLDLRIEYQLSSGFNNKYKTLIDQGNQMETPSREALSTHRKQAAAAFLGHYSHGSLGLLKAGISAGAAVYGFFSRKPSASNNSDCSKEYIEARVSEYQLKIDQFNKMQLALKELRTNIQPIEMENGNSISMHP